MPFDEKIKNEAMKKAAFSCCICRKSSVSVEVHHIIPQSQGGNDSIENAAPLCPNCHSDYGNNADKRTRIKHMRDCWYDTVEKMYSGNNVSPEEIGKIHGLLQYVYAKQDSIINRQSKHDDDLEKSKVMLSKFSNKTIDKMTAGQITGDSNRFLVIGNNGDSRFFPPSFFSSHEPRVTSHKRRFPAQFLFS